MIQWELQWRSFIPPEGGERCWKIATGVRGVFVRTIGPTAKERNRIHRFPSDGKALEWLEAQVRRKLAQGWVEEGGSSEQAAIPVNALPLVPVPHEQWDSIEGWLRRQHEDGPLLLPVAATEADIKAAEKAVRARFPEALRSSYRRHDGTGQTAFAFGRLVSLNELVVLWKEFCESLREGYYDGRINNPVGPIKRVWYSRRWLPVGRDDEGGYLFVDLDPTANGKAGQVIDFTRADGSVHVVATDFESLLASLAADLKAGKYELDTKSWHIVTKKRSRR